MAYGRQNKRRFEIGEQKISKRLSLCYHYIRIIKSGAYGSTLAEKLQRARYDEKTKAVVLRVNSPGGSAIASDIVWREMELLQREKPVVVSRTPRRKVKSVDLMNMYNPYF